MNHLHKHISHAAETKDSSLKVALFMTALAMVILFAKVSLSNSPQAYGMEQLEQINPQQKQSFIEAVRGHVTKVNRKIKYQQALLEKLNKRLASQSFHSNTDLKKLRRLYQEYNLNGKININNYDSELQALQQRMQTVNASIVVAMAALESNWGRSKRALSSNNYFVKSCGILACQPQNFSDSYKSVKTLVHALNTHEKFQVFRNTRAGFQRRGKLYSADQIIGTLKYAGVYSEEEFEILQELISNTSI